MKAEELLDAIGNIDTDMLEEAEHRPAKHKKAIFTTLAACLCLLVAGGAVIGKMMHPFPVKKIPRGEPTYSEATAYVKRWDERNINEKFSGMEYDGRGYFIITSDIKEENLGDPLGTATARGYDIYAENEGKDPNHSIGVELFKIKGIDPSIAVAIRYDGEEELYSAVHDQWRPQTLGEFIDGLNLKEYLVINCAYYEFFRPITKEYVSVRFDNIDPAKVWQYLLSERDVPNTHDDLDIGFPKEQIGLSVSVPVLGFYNVSLSSREDGTIFSNILSTGKKFDIGKANTQAFFDYVMNECEGYEIVYVYSDGEEETSSYDASYYAVSTAVTTSSAK